jgi:hypothetical protein
VDGSARHLVSLRPANRRNKTLKKPSRPTIALSIRCRPQTACHDPEGVALAHPQIEKESAGKISVFRIALVLFMAGCL